MNSARLCCRTGQALQSLARAAAPPMTTLVKSETSKWKRRKTRSCL